MSSIRRSDSVDHDLPVDHGADNIVDGISRLLNANMLPATINDGHFQPVLIKVNGSENSFKPHYFTFALTHVRRCVFLYGVVDRFSGGRSEYNWAECRLDVRANFQLGEALARGSEITSEFQESVSVSRIWHLSREFSLRIDGS